MTKTITLILLLLGLLWPVFTHAQLNKIDSLNQVLRTEKRDTSRVMALGN
jgi:hypothetical protein